MSYVLLSFVIKKFIGFFLHYNFGIIDEIPEQMNFILLIWFVENYFDAKKPSFEKIMKYIWFNVE